MAMPARALSVSLSFIPAKSKHSSSSSAAAAAGATTTQLATSNPRRLIISSHESVAYNRSWSSSTLTRASSRNRFIKCQAAGETSAESSAVYRGVYGPWSVDSTDVREVILYRSGLVTAAASFVVVASTAFLPDNSSLSDLIKHNYDLFYVLGASGLGLSLLLIHIYVTEIKRTLQALWALGVLGSLATHVCLAQPAGLNLVQYVLENPLSVWFVGPLFAALTGLVFKEGLCYGKLEAGILTFVIPSVLLGHLSGLMDDGAKTTLLGMWMALFVIFAGRKFTQPIKDDIGDKSVFIFQSLREEQRKALIEKIERQRSGQDFD